MTTLAKAAAVVVVVGLGLVGCGGAADDETVPDDAMAAGTTSSTGITAAATSSGPTTTFSPPTAPPPTITFPSLPSLVPPTTGTAPPFVTTTTEPLPPPVVLPATTHLQPPGEGMVLSLTPASPASLCAEVASPGWLLEQCEVAGGLAALVERAADDRIRVQVLSDRSTPGTWSTVLAAEDVLGGRWSTVVVVQADVDGDVLPEIWIGYTTVSDELDIDIVSPRRNGTLVRVADHGLRAGRAVIVPGGADTYEPLYLSGDQRCCPTGGAARRQVRVEGTVWTASALPPLPPGTPVPFSSFDTITSD
jgi:hypothetical protein